MTGVCRDIRATINHHGEVAKAQKLFDDADDGYREALEGLLNAQNWMERRRKRETADLMRHHRTLAHATLLNAKARGWDALTGGEP